MKKIGQYLKNKNLTKQAVLDEKTVFYIFKKIIQSEYGNKGVEKVKPDFYKNGKLFISSDSSSWANEMWLGREEIKNKINQELKTKEIKEVTVRK